MVGGSRHPRALMASAAFTFEVQQARIGAASDELNTATAHEREAERAGGDVEGRSEIRLMAQLKMERLVQAARPEPELGGGVKAVDDLHRAGASYPHVFVCGPPGLAAACSSACLDRGVDFHSEIFAF